jgi:glycosyltransferase involved in cell wall biosynthesis
MGDVAILDAPLQSVATPGIAAVLTIIVPTLNERENIEPLVTLLTEALPDTAWEAMFVDDDASVETRA